MTYLKQHTILFILLFSPLVFSQDEDENPTIFAKDVFIELDVSSCYGKCPAYNVTIDGDGNVKYKGKRFTSKKGKDTKQISKKQVALLISKFISVQFFQRTDESDRCYTRTDINKDGDFNVGSLCIMDNHGSILTLSIKIGYQSREIRLEHNYSDDYTDLKNKIIKTAGIESWIKKE